MGRTNCNDGTMVKFYFDRIVDGKPYPNLAIHQAQPYTPEWREFSKKWPFSEPVHFLEYLEKESIEYQLVTTPENAIYPISLSFFDFNVKWFDLINSAILSALKAKTIKIWFLYSEGDNPYIIQDHLIQQCNSAGVDPAQIHFTIANSAADRIKGFSYFADDELLYALRNQQPPVPFHSNPRSKKFTALSRAHKNWRAATMATLWGKNLHTQGYFSYNTDVDINDTSMPLEQETFNGLDNTIQEFLSNCPFTADKHNSDTHNNHEITVEHLFSDSYLNLVLETHLDTENSGGAFLTEKTFKPIKNNQLFIIIGNAGSIELLRQMGYCVFDDVIDHRYDTIQDPTERWLAALAEFETLIGCDLHSIYIDCKSQLEHNSNLFTSTKRQKLNRLLEKVTNESS